MYAFERNSTSHRGTLLSVANDKRRARMQATHPPPPPAVELTMAMRVLWEEHITYIPRNCIISALAGLPDTDADHSG